jgi:nitric oxide reductase NorQ protein
MNIKVAGFVVQDPNSPTSKVYAAFAFRNGNGGYNFLSCSGTGSEWVMKSMRRQRSATPATAAGAEAQLVKIWTEKKGKGYSNTLAGPVSFDVAISAIGDVGPDQLVRAISTEAPVFGSNAELVTRAVAEMTGAPTTTQSSSAASAPHAHSRTRLTLPAAELNGITLPNGKKYFSREVAGHSDVAMLRHLREQARTGGPVLYPRMFGPPGGGKSTLPIAAFGDELVTIHGHGDQMVSHYVGQMVPQTDGTFAYGDGPLAHAMLAGLPCLIDEASRVPAETLGIVLSVADSRGVLNRDDLPGSPKITAQPGFYLMISYNETGMGVRPLDDAVKRRFPVAIEVSADFTAAEAAGVDARAVKLARNLQQKSTEDRDNGGLGCWVPQIADLLVVQQALDAGLGLPVAVATLVSACTDPDSAETLGDEIQAVFNMNATSLTLGGRVIAGAR